MPRDRPGSLDKPRDLCPPDTHGVWNEGGDDGIVYRWLRAILLWPRREVEAAQHHPRLGPRPVPPRHGAHHTDRSLEEHPIMPQDTEKKDEVVNVTTFKSPYGHGDRVWVGDDHETSAVVTGHMFKPGGDMVEVTWMHNGTLQCVWVSPIVLGGR